MTATRIQPNQYRRPDHKPAEGKLAHDPEDVRLCPRCGDVMHEPFTALSRVYKRTKICPDCGQAEGLLQTAGKDATWHPVIYEWNLTLERHREELDAIEMQVGELEEECEHLARERNNYRDTLRQVREENTKFSQRHEKNKEVIHQLSERLKFADSQIRDLLENVLRTQEEDA